MERIDRQLFESGPYFIRDHHLHFPVPACSLPDPLISYSTLCFHRDSTAFSFLCLHFILLHKYTLNPPLVPTQSIFTFPLLFGRVNLGSHSWILCCIVHGDTETARKSLTVQNQSIGAMNMGFNASGVLPPHGTSLHLNIRPTAFQ